MDPRNYTVLIIHEVFCSKSQKKKRRGNVGTEAGRKIPKEVEGKVEDKGKRRRRPGPRVVAQAKGVS